MTSTWQSKNENPKVVMTAELSERLYALATAVRTRSSEVCNRLLEEIDRAILVGQSDLPNSVISIGSEITYRDEETGVEQTVVLVMPQDADIAKRRISILTPIGAALIGLAEGAVIDWRTLKGDVRSLTVCKVCPPRELQQNLAP